MDEKSKVRLEKYCPQGHQECTLNWERIEQETNRLDSKVSSLEEKMKHLPQAFEFRAWIAVLLLIYFTTNPAAATSLKHLLGL